ncbi:MAG: glycosyltransferase family 2 protein [Syntrophobacteraceae bacterium]
MPPALSVVVPLFDEEAVIEEMHSRLAAVLNRMSVEYEILMVNDGSRDGTAELAKGICKRDSRVKLISFSRNFGHQVAISAGIERAVGEAVVVMDADLQDPPELIPEMVGKWREGNQVVYAVRKKRQGESFFKLVTASLFYKVLSRLTPVKIPQNTGDFRLMDRRVVDHLNRMHEKTRFLRGMVSWIGFRQCQVEYTREKRHSGKTKYPLRKMLRFASDGILSFSHAPLKVASAFGFLSSGLSFAMIVYGIFIKFFFPESAIPGWASVFVAILFLGGVQLICLGIIGEYLGRVYEEIKGRPLYIVDEEINFGQQ